MIRPNPPPVSLSAPLLLVSSRSGVTTLTRCGNGEHEPVDDVAQRRVWAGLNKNHRRRLCSVVAAM